MEEMVEKARKILTMGDRDGGNEVKDNGECDSDDC
jgi:hypothetical protein